MDILLHRFIALFPWGAPGAPKGAEFGGSIQEAGGGGKPPQLTSGKAAGHCPD
jgi:hypothetical protein